MQDDKQKQEILNLMGLGIYAQYLGVIFGFCLTHNKQEQVKKITQMVVDFEKSLSEEEKGELKQEFEKMLEVKVDEIASNLNGQMSPEEAQKLLSDIGS